MAPYVVTRPSGTDVKTANTRALSRTLPADLGRDCREDGRLGGCNGIASPSVRFLRDGFEDFLLARVEKIALPIEEEAVEEGDGDKLKGGQD